MSKDIVAFLYANQYGLKLKRMLQASRLRSDRAIFDILICLQEKRISIFSILYL